MSEEKPKIGDIISIVDGDGNVRRVVITKIKKNGTAIIRPCEVDELPEEQSIVE